MPPNFQINVKQPRQTISMGADMLLLERKKPRRETKVIT